MSSSNIETNCVINSSKKRKKSPKDFETTIPELSDRLDCLQKSVANLRIDFRVIIQELLLKTLRDLEARRTNAQ